MTSSVDILGCFATNLICHWNESDQIVLSELHGSDLIQRVTVPLGSNSRPTGVAYHAGRQLLAWSDTGSAKSIFVTELATPARRVEISTDVPGLIPYSFSGDGHYLMAAGRKRDKLSPLTSLRVWDVQTGRTVVSLNEDAHSPTFAAAGRTLAVAFFRGQDHEIVFYDLAEPARPARMIPGQSSCRTLAVSPDGSLLAGGTFGGRLLLFDPAKAERIDLLDAHANAVSTLAFSADGRRLVSTGTGRETVKVWDVRTRQELLTLSGMGPSLLEAKWSADGNVILAGAPWQAWCAPSWAEISATDAVDAQRREKTEDSHE